MSTSPISPASPILLSPSSSFEFEDEINILDETKASSVLGSDPVTTINNGSFVWNYFKKLGSSAKCDICGTSLKYADGSTSNLRKHLKLRTHINKVPELNNEKKSTSVLDMLRKNQQIGPREEFDQGKLGNMIKQWIIMHNRPFYLVEDYGLKAIFAYLEPQAKGILLVYML